MQDCTSLQTDNHASTPPLCFYRPDALPAAQPTASKHWKTRELTLNMRNGNQEAVLDQLVVFSHLTSCSESVRLMIHGLEKQHRRVVLTREPRLPADDDDDDDDDDDLQARWRWVRLLQCYKRHVAVASQRFDLSFVNVLCLRCKNEYTEY